MNKYFNDSTLGYTKSQVTMIKKNNYYLHRALSHLYTSVKNGNTEVGGIYRSYLLSGALPKNDSVTGVNTNELAAKLKFLVIALSDKSHPENIKMFKNSYFYNSILAPLSSGYTVDSDKNWQNFKRKDTADENFKNKGAFEAALLCQRDDTNAPLGLDFAQAINLIVKTNPNGSFYLDSSVSVEDEVAVSTAVSQQLDTFQNNKRFLDNYNNENLSYENEDEDSDEKF